MLFIMHYFVLATYISLASVIMCELVGLEKLTNGFGLLCLVRGITAIAGPPIEGNSFIFCLVSGVSRVCRCPAGILTGIRGMQVP